MITTHIDGLPGLALQGRKGSTGIRGNKVYYITDDMQVKLPDCKSIIWMSDFTIEDLENGEEPTIAGAEPLAYLEEDVYDYDYVLYSADDSTILYIVTEVKSSEESLMADDKETPSSEVKNFVVWKVDSWTYAAVNINELPLSVEVENINIDYVPWKGQYFSNRAECVPAGTSGNSEIPAGHEFSIMSNEDFVARVDDIHEKYGVCRYAKISGYVYTMEVDKKGKHAPLAGIRIALRTIVDIDHFENKEHYEQLLNLLAITDENGYFELDDFDPETTGVDGYSTVLAVDPNDLYLPANYIVTGYTTQEEIENMEIYMYDNAWQQAKRYGSNYHPKYDIRKNDGDDEKPVFYVVDYFNYYDTSRTLSEYDKLDNALIQGESSSESYDSNSEEGAIKKVVYTYPVTSKIPLTRFVVYSSLSSEEKSKIRIEAEFCQNSNLKLATMSTCKKDLWEYTKEEADEDLEYFENHLDSRYCPSYIADGSNDANMAMKPNYDVLAGRCPGFKSNLNFDTENLRDFKIIVKDYGEEMHTNRFTTFKYIPYNLENYTIYMYLYYKNSPSDISKTLLSTQ